jgi:uncharacterized protein
MPRPVHFEIHASDPERLRAFYSSVFGWSVERWGEREYWVIRTGENEPGIDGGLLPRQGPPPEDATPVAAFVCTVHVADLEGSLKTAEQAGARVVVPKRPIPSVGWLAYCKDPDGNLFGMMQEDPGAA